MNKTFLNVVALLSITVCGSPLSADETKPSKPRPPKITISKETTYVTGPLRKDGTVDYVAAINELNSKGVTPENNAATAIWQAIALFQEVTPEAVSEPARRRYFELLGLAKSPKESERLLEYPEFLAAAEGWTRPDSSRPAEPGWDEEIRHFFDAMSAPWSEKDHPRMAKLLERDEKALDLLVAAAQRPRFYSPLVLDEGWEFDDVALLPMLAEHRLSYARFQLHARAMLRLERGQIAEAWRDALAWYRLARLQTQGVDVGLWVFLSLRGPSTMTFLEYANVAPDRIKAWQADLSRLPKADSLADSWGKASRLYFLGKLTDIASHGYRQTAAKKICLNDMHGTGCFGGSTDDDAHAKAYRVFTADPRIDWNEVLRRCNAHFDTIVAACNEPIPSRRQVPLARLKGETAKNAKRALELASRGDTLPADMTPKAISHLFVDAFLEQVCQWAGDTLNRDGECQVDAIGLELALGLTAYRYDHKKYPKTLAELAPKYVARIPADPFTGGQLHYKPETDGYTLYSVGPNGKDDGGRNAWRAGFRYPSKDASVTEEREKQQDWDDVAIGMLPQKAKQQLRKHEEEKENNEEPR